MQFKQQLLIDILVLEGSASKRGEGTFLKHRRGLLEQGTRVLEISLWHEYHLIVVLSSTSLACS